MENRNLMALGGGIQTPRIMDVMADNMAPTVSYGDKLIIDANDLQITAAGGVYAFLDSGQVTIQRAEKCMGSNDVLVSNDNPAYSSFRVPIESLTVLGRVVFFARELTQGAKYVTG